MEGGYDTASNIYDVAVAAKAKYGTPKYWLRYFSPSVNVPVNFSSSHAIAECRAAWDSGGKAISPICEPPQSHLSGTYAEGQADAQTYVSALHSVYSWVDPLAFPSNGIMRCWLAVEPSTALSQNYWSGWSAYVNTHDWSGFGYYPLYAMLYCNPCNGHANCSSVRIGGCYGMWSQQPQVCGKTLSSLPTWNPKSCQGSSCGGPSTVLWQFNIVTGCSVHLTVNVDMDEGDLSSYAFYLTNKP